MKHWLTSSRRLPRRLTAKILLRLETLEERTLLDGTGQVLYHPEAVLAPGYGKRGVPVGPPSSSDHSPPPPGGFANVLVNDPAEDGTSADDTQSETALTLDGSTVIAAYNDSFRAPLSPPHYTGFSRSDDGGQTFVDGGGLPNVNSTTGDVGDPVLAHDNQTGRTYLVTLGFTTGFAIPSVYIWRSDDDLRTFLAPVGVTRSGASLDKEWLAVDNFKGPSQGNVYLIVRDFGSGNGIYLFHSTDQGATFGPSNGVQIASGSNGNVQGAWVTVGPDHAVYAFWFDNTTATESIKVRKSTDGGQTFGSPVTVTTLRTTGVNGDLGLGGGFRSNAFPQAVVNPTNGQIYVAYDDKGVGNDKADVYFRYSSDGGTTWSAATDVIDDTTGHDQWQPALAVNPSGNAVGVFWYDRRVDPGNSLIDRFGAIGVVAGGKVSFGPNFRITDTSFPVEIGHDPQINGVYMGDYDTAVADVSGFYVTWGDNRLASRGHTGHNADVRIAHIPFSVAGPAVIGVTPRGTTFPPVSTLRVVFDEAMDPKTLTPDQFQLTDSNGNPINIDKITPVDDSDQRFDVTFDTQSATDIYSYKIGPYIADQNGNYMDQNGNGIPGEDPDDAFFGTIALAGPKVTASTPTGNANMPGSVDHVRLTFNEPVDPSTFTTDQVSFTGPDGNPIPINDIQPVTNSNNTQFDISFDTLVTTGAYSMVIGPYILDPYGNAMDQNGNFIPGEIPDDQYVLNFGVLGPKVTASTPTGNSNNPGSINHVRLTFNEPVDSSTFTTDQVSFTGPDGSPVPINDIQPVTGTNNTQFDISFDALAVTGAYHLVVGPYVLDLYGNAMDQNGNLIPGEIPGDQYTTMFGVLGPKITASTPMGNANLPGSVDHIRLTFNEAMDLSTFTSDQIVFTGPDGSAIPITDVEPVAGTNNTQFDLSFDTLTVAGTYHLVFGPYVLDTFGNAMDQNGNLIPGEVPGDQYATMFGVAPPQVSRFARNGQQNQPATSVRVTFNEPIDPSTFTPDQIINFVDPQGNPITATDVEPVAGTNNTQFDITFDQQTLAGTYTLQIAAGILDLYGNALPAAYTGMFIITPVYTASAYDFEPLDIHGLPGTFRVLQYADDTSVAVNLGSHTFNFYGVIYTGNNQLFVSSNGLITFGSSDSSPGNTDLTTSPSQPAIAVLWADWIKTSGTDMVEAYFDDANDRLILQWNAVQHYPSSPRGITFQLILYLDTGGNAGAIVFNYVDLDTGDGNRDGQTATIGIKNAGNQGVDRVLVSYDHSNPLVGSNLAILLSVDAGGGPGIHGGRGRLAEAVSSSAALAPLADLLPVATAPQSLTVARSPELARPEEEGTPLALLEAGSARSVDQVFARFTAEDLLAGARHHSAAALDDVTDALTLDLVGEPL